VYCSVGPDRFLVGVQLEQVLCGLAGLGEKLREFDDTRVTSGPRV
jgi:hypothetical protein